jgi:hypothetical protein
LGNRSSNGSDTTQSWLIPRNEVKDGGPGKDGIPALEDPEFISAGSADYLAEDDMVIGLVVGDEARAYSHDILDWHEIVNDQVYDVSIAVTYCPLTGTGIGWNREIDGNMTTFGVSGLLYNSNLIPYDRASDSNWSQIRLDCVNGKLKGKVVETIPMVETTWKTWKMMYPDTRVLSTSTGHERPYGRYPYGNYRTDDDLLLFPVAHEDDRIPKKERVLGIVLSGNLRAYRFSELGISMSVIQEEVEGLNLVIAGNREDNFMVAFLNDPGDGTRLSFSAVQDQYPVVMSDEEGNLWDVNGRAVDGPRKGSRLGNLPSCMGYWFSFAAFYPELTIYGSS